MKVLLASAKRDFGEPLDAALCEVKKRIGEKADVIGSDEPNWNDIRTVEGGWDKAYAWAARNFDAIVLLETKDGGLGRGQFELAQGFMRLRKSVGVLRGDRICKVANVRESGDNNWKSYYGVVEVTE